MLDCADTIAAIASAAGGAVRGIIRLSGPQVIVHLSPLFVATDPSDWTKLQKPTRVRGWLKLSTPLGDVPCDLFLWPTARSYTRQPSAELHLPGSGPILQNALAELGRHGVRLATPGEFTLRAFLAGRIDLTQAEAVLGVIDAQSQSQLQVALAQLSGGLAAPLSKLRGQLLDLLAHLEAGLDFVEEDIEFITAVELRAQLTRIADHIESVWRQMQQRTAASEAYRVVLVGPPNAGKSSLFNALARKEAAIVSAIAGTTRDYVTCEWAVDGLRCLLTDTAGLTEASTALDIAAQQQAERNLRDAHVLLVCAPAGTSHPQIFGRAMNVWTKGDLLTGDQEVPSGVVLTSVSNGTGLTELEQHLAAELRALDAELASVVGTTAARCETSLAAAAASLRRALELVGQPHVEELVASELRVALEELGLVVGTVSTDDILDRIFSRFCIGK